ncbi:MAG: ABC transporter ATP-binding protein [Gemmatimonadaceae bacterium]
MYRRLLRFLRPHVWRLAGTIASTVGAAVLDAYAFALLIPFLNALFGGTSLLPPDAGFLTHLLNATIGAFLDPNDKMGSLQNVILFILGTVALKSLLVWMGGQFGAQLQEFVVRDMRDAVYSHLQRLPLGYFIRTRTGQILSRVLSDTEQTKQLITQLITSSLQSIALIAAYIAFLFAISWRLTLVALVAAPLLVGALQPLLRRLRKGYRRLRNDFGEMTSVLQEVVTGVRLVKSFGAEEYEQRRFREASHRYSRGLVSVTRYAFMSQPLTELIGTMVAVLILWFGARQVLVDDAMQGSQLIVFLTVVMRLLQPMKSLSQVPTSAQAAFASAERLFEILDMPTEAQLDRGTRGADSFARTLEFQDVSFSYGDEPVLRDVNFSANRGDVVALVGPSGAGKSTLVDLIPRFHEPTSGRILLDGVDTREICLPALRALTGIVSQETVLFNDSVRNNLAYGVSARFSDSEVEAAARAANADGFIRALPDGYATLLGERGARLSGGQRQRLAIARALLIDPPILILDEATSALDSESERLVQEAIDRLLQGRTVFVIAHRLSTVEHATRILVLDRGRIVERGTHEELIERGGMYHRLHALQFRPPATASPSRTR